MPFEGWSEHRLSKDYRFSHSLLVQELAGSPFISRVSFFDGDKGRLHFVELSTTKHGVVAMCPIEPLGETGHFVTSGAVVVRTGLPSRFIAVLEKALGRGQIKG